MDTPQRNFWQSLGFLRQGLFILVFINMLLPVIEAQLIPGADRSLWHIIGTMIAPVMAPVLTVVLLIEYVMSLVHSVDAEGERRAYYKRICRIELGALLLSLIFWIPFFILLLS
ncbi:MAG: hypothetical protein PVI79_09950 [Gammaproteobacteria bacterium]|jgi:hypothetical protein